MRTGTLLHLAPPSPWTRTPRALLAAVAAVALLTSHVPSPAAAAAGDITTVAGGYIGDGGLATNAVVLPGGVAVDGHGNVFIADSDNHRVRKVDAATGVIETVAGDGNSGSSGDGGPATQAGLRFPEAVAVDGQGNILIADTWNHRIRKVDAVTGIIDTVAGRPATEAGLSFPSDVGVDGQGNIFIADRLNHRVRRVDAATGVMETVAGDGTRGFAGDGGPAIEASLRFPRGVAVDGQGNVLIADGGNYSIRRVDATTGVINTLAGVGIPGFTGDGGPATEARMVSASDVALDGEGNIFIAASHRVRMVDAATGIIDTVAGDGNRSFSGDGGPATSASLAGSVGVALDGQGNLFIAGGHRIRMVDVAGVIDTVAGGFSGDDGLATGASLVRPGGVALDGQGNILIADTGNHRIRKVDAVTGVITTAAGDGNYGFSGDSGPATAASFRSPGGVAVDHQGNILIADTQNHRVRRVVTATGVIDTVAGGGTAFGDGGLATQAILSYPYDIALDGHGNIFIADRFHYHIRRVDAATGVIETVAGDGNAGFSGDGGPATSASLARPLGVAVGRQGNLFIADGHRVRMVDASTGVMDTVAGGGTQVFSGDGGPAVEASLNAPEGVVVDGQGNIFIADMENHRVRRVDASTAVITSVAGSGPIGIGMGSFFVDIGPANTAGLSEPSAVAVDGQGNLLIADTLNHRIRMVEGVAAGGPAPAPLPSTAAWALLLLAVALGALPGSRAARPRTTPLKLHTRR